MKRILLMALALCLGASTIAQKKNWEIIAKDIVPGKYAAVTVANGITGFVSSPHPFQWQRVIMNGVYDVYERDRVSHLLETLNPLGLQVKVDGELITRNDQVKDYQQVLHLKEGALTTSFTVGDKAIISYTIYSLRHLPYVSLLDIQVKALQKIKLEFRTAISMPGILNNRQQAKYELKPPHHSAIKMTSTTALSPTGAVQLAASSSFMAEGKAIPELQFGNNDQYTEFMQTLDAGKDLSVALLGAMISSRQNTDPLNQSQRMLAFAQLEGKQRLLDKHKAAWEKLWESDIELTGDDAMQLDIRQMIYHLYSFAREGSAYSIPPMGLSNLWYSGHIFWDSEIWMFPALLLLQPEMARSMLEYRFERLEAARKNAQVNGYKGAMFPWESAESGFEETPVYALSGPFEHHITADIGIAAWNFYCVTRDLTWLEEKGYPLLKETADFWLSRVEKNGDHYDINNVVAADEWAENVDNNAFTNAAAKANLRYAAEAARLLKKKPDQLWLEVAGKIKIESFPDGVVKEHSRYNGEKIKQADVNLLSYPLKEITDNRLSLLNLEYYYPRVGDGPAMSHSVFSVIYSRIGDPEKALTAFKEGLHPNALPPFGVIAETRGGTNPYFATGAGGLLQAFLNGFGGLDITRNGIVQLPTRLPRQWQSLRLKGIGIEKKEYLIINK
ncbi:MAG: glycoside hydrolase family 65 protein [Candidatus Pseudobacter hemicellulosilyticus]|uniref:Glycoside hydrolase family 65 protein n=1 Tax=Candidatus Pseudobacter hemicellulosilyticus TaxID=3121375 RepID=A0AAJ5WNS7_9BACT|nr:MAG: glycoside hydrolase family 65 protein [Pseudobacter sp.]